ncbi:MAG TPA: hypothetical protein VFF38_06685, partial [Microvirga sp.]|nr:hypothetical protein [Microvirga sp.]
MRCGTRRTRTLLLAEGGARGTSLVPTIIVQSRPGGTRHGRTLRLYVRAQARRGGTFPLDIRAQARCGGTLPLDVRALARHGRTLRLYVRAQARRGGTLPLDIRAQARCGRPVLLGSQAGNARPRIGHIPGRRGGGR